MADRNTVIAQAREWAEKTKGTKGEARWKRFLLAAGETVAGAEGLAPMTAAEARGYVARGWNAWRGPWEVLAALTDEPAPAAPAQPSAAAPAMGALFTIHGVGIDDLVPGVGAEDWSWVAGSPDDLADLKTRVDHIRAWSEAQFRRILNRAPHALADLLHPLQAWGDEAGFLRELHQWEPAPVPAPEGFEAKAVLASGGPLLTVLFPGRQVVVNDAGWVNDWQKEGADTFDPLKNPWNRARQIDVEWSPDGVAWAPLSPVAIPARPRVLLTHYGLPGGAGQVRMRIKGFAVDQTGEERTGEWTAPASISHAFEDAREAWVDDDAAYDFSAGGDAEAWRGDWWLPAVRSTAAPGIPL